MKEKEPWRDVRALFSGSAPSGARFVCAPWGALAGESPEHAQVVGNV